MRRSIATVSLSGTLPEKLEAIAAARFNAVEIFEADLLHFAGSPRQVRAMAADLGLEIALYQPFRDFEAVPEADHRRNLERAERKFELMQELGAPLLLVCSNVSPRAIDDEQRAADQLAELAERAARHRLRIGYEALAWGAHVRTWAQAWRIVERANHPHLGLVLDSFHTLALGDDPAGIADLPWAKLAFVQLADAPRLKLDLLTWSRHFRCFPGQGELDVAGFLAAALAAGYAGPISLEIFSDELRAGPPRQSAQDGMRSLLFLEEQVRARLAAAPVPAAHPARRPELFDPPPPPDLGGVAFLEFAVDDAAEADLGGLLAGLGFRRTGRHRTKRVTLWQQGGISLVLNAEPDSFAHAYFLVHGPAICAMALSVDDEAQGLARAEAFGATRFDGRVGPNELTIPAIRAPDGSLIYFTPAAAAFDRVDFLPDEDLGPGLGLDAVDHVAQALPGGQLDGWLLFYRAVLGLEPAGIWVLPDPYGLVRSRAMASANRRVRIPLNISQSANTATARSVSTFAGAGVHHIAFSTGDLLATVRGLRQHGVPLLPIPANYYDDLAARTDLSAARIAELQAHDVLYDRTEAGEFLHVYTDAFQGRFFFEVVQRIGGYDQYGAANAPVRMAVQAQLRQARQAGRGEVAL